MNTTTTGATPLSTKKTSNPFARGAIIDGKRVERWKADNTTLDAPLTWRRPRMIFVCAHGDLFHEEVPDWWIYLTLAVMSLTYDVATTDEQNVITRYRERHVYQVLTKRSVRMRAFMAALHKAASGDFDSLLNHPFARASAAISKAAGHPAWMNASLCTWQWVIDGCPGLWLGVSAEDQKRAEERIPDLLATPAAVRFVSAEPLLGPIDLAQLQDDLPANAWLTWIDGLDWVIVGGESGHRARPTHLAWHRSLMQQCAAAGVAFFEKQLGRQAILDRHDAVQAVALGAGWDAVEPGSDLGTVTFRNRKGGDQAEWPADLRVQQMPGAAA